jgi:hypothetical protein
MTVEVNIIYREKTAAIVVPNEAVSGNAVQVVSNGKVDRVPVTVGIRGSRNVEIIGNVSKDTTVLSPARADLADGTRVRVENLNVPAKPAPEAPVDATPDPAPGPTSGPGPAPSPAPGPGPSAALDRNSAAAVVTSSVDADNAVISSAISAHVDSIVNDARRNVGKYSATR